MSAERSDSALFPVSAIGIILAALASSLWSVKPLDSDRHSEPVRLRRGVDLENVEFIPARLWQDPLSTAYSYLETLDLAGREHTRALEEAAESIAEHLPKLGSATGVLDALQHGGDESPEREAGREPPVDVNMGLPESKAPRAPLLPHLLRLTKEGLEPSAIYRHIDPGLHDEASEERGRALLMLGVMVAGSPTAEGAEQRRRQRQAVISSLASHGYIPEDPDRIGVIQDLRGSQSDRGPLIPYEWMVHLPQAEPTPPLPVETAEPYRHVLVLWLDESVYRRKDDEGPLRQIADLYADLLRQSAERHFSPTDLLDPDIWESISLRVVGPTSSDLLLDMSQDLMAWTEAEQLLSVVDDYLDDGLPKQGHAPDDSAHGPVEDAVQAFYEAVGSAAAARHIGDLPGLTGPCADAVEQFRRGAKVAAAGTFIRSRDPSKSDGDEIERMAPEIHAAMSDCGLVMDEGAVASALGRFSAAMTDAVQTLASGLETRFPGVDDGDPDWARSTVMIWWWNDDALEAGVDANIRVLSPRATVSHETMRGRPELSDWPEGVELTDLPRQTARGERESILEFTVAEDHILAFSIVQELQRRGIRLHPEPDPAADPPAVVDHAPCGEHHPERDVVVVISEWDTLFGRSLPRVLAAAAHYAHENGDAADVEDFDAHLATYMDKGGMDALRELTYLRGLDGILPATPTDSRVLGDGGAQALAASPSGATDAMSLVGPGHAERAVGRNQKDQLARIAAQLDRIDIRLRDSRRGKVAAIGVLGSDYYDKHLVLEALKSRFPHAVFFTTDLDARMLHHEAYESHRNLVVVSSHGLSLSRHYRGHMVPFRESYQVGDALACMRALEVPGTTDRGAPRESRLAGDIAKALWNPRIFEIARDGAIDLTPLSAAEVRDPEHPRLHPVPHRGLWEQADRRRQLLALVLVLTTVLLLLRRSVRRSLWTRPVVSAASVLTVAGAFTLLGLVMYGDSTDSEGEPFRMLSGISIWPTEIMRLVATFYCLAALFRSTHALEHNAARIEAAYKLERGPCPRLRDVWWPRPTTGRTTWGHRLLHVFRQRRDISITAWAHELDEEDTAAAKTPQQIWIRYRKLGRPSSRVARTAPLVLAYLAAAWALLEILGWPYAPARGATARLTDQVMLIVSSTSAIVLMIYVVDASRLTGQFVRALRKTRENWPATAGGRLDQLVSTSSLDPETLSGYMDTEVIAERTRPISKLILQPSIALLLLLIGRNALFDAWTWPVALTIIFSTLAVVTLGTSTMLRRSAELARRQILTEMEGTLLSLQGRRQRAERRCFEQLLEEVRHLRAGVFAPWASNPVLRAVLIPFGGVGSITLIESLMRMNAG